MIYGELGIRPWELEQMTFKQVMLAIEGLRNRDKLLESWIRRATCIIGSSNFGGKAVAAKFDRLWPTEKGPVNVSQRALDQLRKFRESEALKRAKQKLDGRA